jgi:bla regulator protein blaR1
MIHRTFQPVRFAGIAGLALAIGALRAQTAPDPPKYQFEVASIKPSRAADTSNRLSTTPQGGLRAENVTPVQLMALAFGVRPFLIVDAPDWAGSQRFDVIATPDRAEETPADAAGGQAIRDRIRQRVQALLMDRFGLVIRAEKRPMPVYKLVVAKGGHKMKEAAAPDRRSMQSNSKNVRGMGVDMKTLADSLAGLLTRPVLDETSLSGVFDLEMQFADLRLQATPDATPAGVGDQAPAIFTAIVEQLGLRLESARAPAPVFVVEKIQRPSEN